MSGVIQCRKIDTVELYHHQIVRRTLYVIVHIEIYKSTVLAVCCVCVEWLVFSLLLSRCILNMLFISFPMFSLYSLACLLLSFFLSTSDFPIFLSLILFNRFVSFFSGSIYSLFSSHTHLFFSSPFVYTYICAHNFLFALFCLYYAAIFGVSFVV